jgi:hypothetical protein
MAAKLLHRERQQLLIAQFAHAHAHAAKDPSDNGREWWTTRATQAAAHLRDLPSWQTLHRKLKKRKK